MKYRILVSFLLDEDDPDMAEVELESALSDMLSLPSTTIGEFHIVDIDELEEEEI